LKEWVGIDEASADSLEDLDGIEDEDGIADGLEDG
jgi:hypothetical protein